MRRRRFMAASVGFGTAALAAGWKIIDNHALPGTVLRGGPGAAGERLYRGFDIAFGTTVSVQLVHDDERQANLAIEDAFAETKKVDALMSIHREGSQVHALNASGGVDRPHPYLLAVLKAARELSVLTDGAFDVTVQPLWRTYEQAETEGGLPSDAGIDHARALVGWQRMAFDGQRVQLLQPGMAITLNGIAQGFATDLALARVRERGIRHALLDTGEYGAIGSRDRSRPWLLAVQEPRKREPMQQAFRMDGRCVATSGDYEMHFSADYAQHHIFDPHTGKSPPELASVTVLAPTGMLADGLSTALMVMGKAKAMKLVASLENVDAMLIDKAGARWQSTGFPLV